MKNSNRLHLGSWMGSTVRTAATTVTIAAMTLLPSGLARASGTVTFACDGTITLANTISNSVNTVLNGTGHQITISGNTAVRVFYVNTGTSLTLSNLTIANGYSTEGGAIFNLGTNVIDNCTFRQNSATTFTAYSSAVGGAICNLGNITISHSTFTNNSAFGGPFGEAGNGGAIYTSGFLGLQRSVIALNVTTGGYGLPGITGSVWGFWPYGVVGQPGGNGGIGGNGSGAIFNSGTAILVNDTVAFNQSFGGTGGTGGDGGPTILTNYFGSFSNGNGGNGGPGGSASGGICDTSGNLRMTNCTVAFNSSVAGAGGPGGNCGSGNGSPGSPGSSGINGAATGGVTMLSCVFANTLLASNTPVNGSGTVVDGNCNLSSDASVAFTGTGSRTNVNPMLGPLANNGGPTLTMALLPGSPAIDAASAAGAPATDQRGVARPQGPGVDIGAFEYQYLPVFTGAKFQNTTNFWLQFSGLLPAQTFKLQSSTNLTDWLDLTNFAAGGTVVYEFLDGNVSRFAPRFYRLKAGTP